MASENLINSKLKFLSGTQAALDALRAGTGTQTIDANNKGAFYLTQDTHRLYIQESATDIVPVNEGLTTVAELKDLPAAAEPNAGYFYYISNLNILAVSNGKKWVQINSDTNNTLSSVAFQKNTTETNKSQLVYDVTFKDKDIDGVEETDETKWIKTTFTIDANDIETLVTDVALDVEAEVADEQATVKLSGTGVDSDATGFTVAGAHGTKIITNENNDIVIDSKTYGLKLDADAVTISLPDEDGTTSGDAIAIKDDDTYLDVSAEDTIITIKHNTVTDQDLDNIVSDTSTKLQSYKLSIGDSEGQNENSTFTVVTGVTADAAGHVSEVSKTKFSLPDSTYSIAANGKDDEKQPVTTSISIKNSDGSISNSTDLVINHKITVDGIENTVDNGNSLGSFYSALAIDQKLIGLNALTYKGPVNSSTELPTTGVKIGDTYKVNKAGDYTLNTNIEPSTVASCEIGYLLIANGTEDTNGVITEGTLYWDLIESGESSDTTYTMYGSNDHLYLRESTDGNAVGDITITDDDVVILSMTNSDSSIDYSSGTLTASHRLKKDIADDEKEAVTIIPSTSDTTVGYGKSFTAVTKVRSDKYGHITDYSTDTFTIPGVDTIEASEVQESNTVVGGQLAFKDGDGNKQGSIAIKATTELENTVSTDNKGNLVSTITHAEVANKTENTETDGTFTVNGNKKQFSAITSVTFNEYGHTSEKTTTTFTMPELVHPETKESNTSYIKQSIQDNSANEYGSIELTSSTLELTVNANNTNAMNVDLVWGTF